MDLFNRIQKLRPNVSPDLYALHDNSDGNGPFIIRWDSGETKPTDVEIASVDDTKAIWVQAQAEIDRLEGEITIRRIREAYTDATWMNAQEALIATERAKL